MPDIRTVRGPDVLLANAAAKFGPARPKAKHATRINRKAVAPKVSRSRRRKDSQSAVATPANEDGPTGGEGCWADIRAYGDVVLARRVDREPAGRIVLPERLAAKQLDTSPMAIVFSVGPLVREDIHPGDLIVMGSKWGGYDVDIGGHAFVFVRVKDIALAARE